MPTWNSKAEYTAWLAAENKVYGLPAVGINGKTGLPDPTAQQTITKAAPNPPLWVQPVPGTLSAPVYGQGALVEHNGKVWASTTPNNVWEPGVSGWQSAPQDGSIGDWVQPTGAHDAYRLGAKVADNNQYWINTGSDANVWRPGDFGWELFI